MTRLLLIEDRLREPLPAWVAARRDQGMSWRLIAIDLSNRTGVDITGERLRVWMTTPTGRAA